jgi:AraC family transcriptional regulator of adaptative response/methylated-DNA-[protein]-cysteine methyltransferase
MSPFHLQRVFQQWAGVSPKQFLSHLTRTAALQRLRQGDTVLDAAFEAGLSGPGRLHDLVINAESVTPGEVRSHGTGLELAYGFSDTPFGRALLGWGERGITFLAFTSDAGDEQALDDFQNQWKLANLTRDDKSAATQLNDVFTATVHGSLKLWLRGSPFQLLVWQALLKIPEGHCVSYGRLAELIGKPGAARAVGSAVGANPVAWLIPCHRVITAVGGLGGYRWGVETKQAILGREWTAGDAETTLASTG